MHLAVKVLNDLESQAQGQSHSIGILAQTQRNLDLMTDEGVANFAHLIYWVSQLGYVGFECVWQITFGA